MTVLIYVNTSKQVGDADHLNFFKTLVDDDEADEDEAVLSESVLEMANATFRPARRLRWHYRSRHSGLIKFSNRLVYDDNLIVFPSATEAMTRMGVEYRQIEGRYKAGTNPIEAKAMVDAALEFMRTDPDRSLGVVPTANASQTRRSQRHDRKNRHREPREMAG
jgi:superfamily I DNA and/or RNA helicase